MRIITNLLGKQYRDDIRRVRCSMLHHRESIDAVQVQVVELKAAPRLTWLRCPWYTMYESWLWETEKRDSRTMNGRHSRTVEMA